MREPHAIARARERYGLELTVDDLDQIRADAAAGRTVLTRMDLHAETHLVMVENVAILAVISRTDSRVITVLPPGGRPKRSVREEAPCGR